VIHSTKGIFRIFKKLHQLTIKRGGPVSRYLSNQDGRHVMSCTRNPDYFYKKKITADLNLTALFNFFYI
jgi:hypothetical protein